MDNDEEDEKCKRRGRRGKRKKEWRGGSRRERKKKETETNILDQAREKASVSRCELFYQVVEFLHWPSFAP